MRVLGDLWRGRLGLAEAFWTWAVLVGMAVNGIATAGTLAAVAAGWPGGLALAVHLAPTPYNVAIVAGVWRSAARYDGAPLWADFARVFVVAWAVFLTLV